MRSARDRLDDVLEAIRRIEREAAAGRDQFLIDEKLQVWMIHHIQIIGEAVRAVSNELEALAPGVPWRAIVGMRHILVHDYFGIDLDEVWAVVCRDIPILKSDVEELLTRLPGEPAPSSSKAKG